MGAVDWAQKAFEIARTLNNAELLAALAQLKSDNAGKIIEIADLKGRIRELEAQASAASELHLEDGVYWRGERPDGDLSAQPLCTACWDDKRKQIHMTVNRGEYHDDYFKCAICQYRVVDSKGTRTSDWNAGRTSPYENY